MRTRTFPVNRPRLNEVGDDGASPGAVVAVLDLDTGEESVYTLMSGERLDIDAGHVSRDSPIGQSLFGAKSGTTVTVETPQRTRRLRILSITPPPDAPEPPPPAA